MALRGLFQPGRRAQALKLAHALRSVPLFREAPADDLVAIWRCLSEVPVQEGALVCARGEPGDCLFIVQSGALEVRLGSDPNGIAIRRALPGDFVGEIALLTGEPRSADVVAVEDASLWALDRTAFEALLASRPSLSRALNRALAEHLALTTRLLEEREAAAGVPRDLRPGERRASRGGEPVGSGRATPPRPHPAPSKSSSLSTPISLPASPRCGLWTPTRTTCHCS